MPTILTLFGLRFFFYADDHEPMHVHVQRDDSVAKFEFSDDEIVMAYNHGLSAKDIKNAKEIIETYREDFTNKWKSFFGK